ncbi:MAG: sirohydrochlorin chelatase, partial [Bacillus sp. (in: firmicutes)]
MRGILYIGHGTRSKEGAAEANSFIHRVMERIDVSIQEMSFLELTEPSIEEGFRRCVIRGATEITVIPLFLLSAGHIKEDIPQALTSLQKRFPNIEVKIRNPFGVQGR